MKHGELTCLGRPLVKKAHEPFAREQARRCREFTGGCV